MSEEVVFYDEEIGIVLLKITMPEAVKYGLHEIHWELKQLHYDEFWGGFYWNCRSFENLKDVWFYSEEEIPDYILDKMQETLPK